MKIFYSPECLSYSQPGHPESPARVQSTHEYLEDQGYSFSVPHPCSENDILLAHNSGLLERVRDGNFFDPDTPAFKGIFDIARLSAGAAIDAAMHTIATGESSFSLMRPPGHHATRHNLGGFCYFNNIAIACLKAIDRVSKIAIVDFDCHHGNGTEDILMGREGFLYLSLHQSPLFPGTGLMSRDNCINYPLSEGSTPEEFLAKLQEGLKAVDAFRPDVVAVSAGFDSYRLDPITSLSLDLDTYEQTGSMIRGLDSPVFAVLEGGYSRDLPKCIFRFLQGLEMQGD